MTSSPPKDAPDDDTGAAPDPFVARDPLSALRADRAAAREARDANAELCMLATVDATGAPRVRTLVLREREDGFALFVSRSSPKWRELAAEPRAELLCWFPALQRQWRLEATLTPLPPAASRTSWHQRPRVAQLLDHFHATQHAQSSPVPEADTVARGLAALDAQLPPEPEVPDVAGALSIDVTRAECMALRRDPEPHRRLRWTREAGGWRAEHLVP